MHLPAESLQSIHGHSWAVAGSAQSQFHTSRAKHLKHSRQTTHSTVYSKLLLVCRARSATRVVLNLPRRRVASLAFMCAYVSQSVMYA